jgi:hypothetical protein
VEPSRRELYWFNWGAVGVTASVLVFAMLSCGGLFNDGFRNFTYLAVALPLLTLTARSGWSASGPRPSHAIQGSTEGGSDGEQRGGRGGGVDGRSRSGGSLGGACGGWVVPAAVGLTPGPSCGR